MQASSFLVDGDDVTGMIGWSELRVADPAHDLHWVLGARAEHVAESGFRAYNQAHP